MKYFSLEHRNNLSLAATGRKLSEETKKKISKIKSGFKHSESSKKKMGLSRMGKKNGRWRGDRVGYVALHLYIKKRFSKPRLCPRCQQEKKLELANKFHVYNRNLSNWMWLCTKCHRGYDKSWLKRKRNLYGRFI